MWPARSCLWRFWVELFPLFPPQLTQSSRYVNCSIINSIKWLAFDVNRIRGAILCNHFESMPQAPYAGCILSTAAKPTIFIYLPSSPYKLFRPSWLQSQGRYQFFMLSCCRTVSRHHLFLFYFVFCCHSGQF